MKVKPRKTKRLKPKHRTPPKLRIRGAEASLDAINKPRSKRAESLINLRSAYMEVFEILGGVEEFARWAARTNKNQTEFYKQLSKMLPRDVVVKDDNVTPNDLSNLTEQELDAIIADSIKSR